MTGVNVKGATFNRNAQIDTQQVGKGGTFFNGQSQIGSQVDIGLGGLGFINKGSQVQKQVGCGNLIHNPTELKKCMGFGRKKREAQFTNIGSQIGQQIGFDGSIFRNTNSQVGKQLASRGADIGNAGGQFDTQIGFGSNTELFSALSSFGGSNFPSSGNIFNEQSQIGTQFGGRKK